VGIRFRKTIKLLPGLRLNLSGRGASVSLGARGFHYTVGPRGTRTTVSVPGTGLSWSEYRPYSKTPRRQQSIQATPYPAFSQTEAETRIESAPIDAIAARSTSELVPLLNELHRRWRLSRATMLAVILTISFGALSNEPVFFATALGLLLLIWPLSLLIDHQQKSLKLKYELDSDAQSRVNLLNDAFRLLSQCRAIWYVTSEALTNDRKHHAGASLLTTRTALRAQYGRPAVIRGNWKFPALSFPKQTLYFAPDAILVVSSNSVSALDYRDLDVSASARRFIEDSKPPTDANVVGQTWQYVNKNGGPDRRFASNRMLPVCLYGEIDFASAGGLNERLQCSQAETASSFVRALQLMQSDEEGEPATIVETSLALPDVTVLKLDPRTRLWALWAVSIMMTAAVTFAVEWIYPIERAVPAIQSALNSRQFVTARSDSNTREEAQVQTYRIAPSSPIPERPIPLPRPRPKNVDRPSLSQPMKLQ
jgi:Protein of unknown function (DUF4236)